MKQSQVKPGVYAMLSLGGRRGAVRVVVKYQRTPERAGDVRWAVEDSSGRWHTATPRQLQPVPDGPTSVQQEAAAEHYAFMRAAFMTDPNLEQVAVSADGQTLTIG